MAFGDPLTILFDPDCNTRPAPTQAGHLATTLDGWQEDLGGTATATYMLPDRRGLLCVPVQETSEWATRTEDDGEAYRRLRATEFVQVAGSITEIEYRKAKDYWLLMTPGTGGLTMAALNSSFEPVTQTIQLTAPLEYGGVTIPNGTTMTPVHANVGWHLSVWPYGQHFAGAQEVVSLEWLDVTGSATPLAVVMDARGFVTLAATVGTGTASVTETVSGQLFGAGSVSHGAFSLTVIPTCRNCIYVLGEGGRHLVWKASRANPAVDDLTAWDAEDPILPESIPIIQTRAKALVQATPVLYLPGKARYDEHISTRVTDWWKVAIADATFSMDGLNVYDDNGGTVTLTASPLKVKDLPDDNTLRFDVAMDPGSNWFASPALYAAGYRLGLGTAVGRQGVSNVESYVLSGATLEAGEEQTTFRFSLKDQVWDTFPFNRTIEVWSGTSLCVFHGQTTAQSVSDGWDHPFIDVEAGDWKQLEKYLLPKSFVYDGQKLTDAVKHVLEFAGIGGGEMYAAEIDIDESDVTLPTKGPNQDPSDSEPAISPSQGQTMADFLRYLRDTFSDWYMDFAPGSGTSPVIPYKFRFKKSAPGGEPAATFYLSMDDARAAGYASGEDTVEGELTPGSLKYPMRVCRNVSYSRVEPEATEVWVIGVQPDGTEIPSDYTDWKAQDPASTSPPDNWVGDCWQYILYDPTLTSKDDVARALNIIAGRITKAYERITFETAWHPEINRHDWIKIVEPGGATYHAWEVLAYTVDFGTDATGWHTMRIEAERKIGAADPDGWGG